MQIGDSVRLNLKLNARSTCPLTGESTPRESFQVIKKGTVGEVVGVKTPGFVVVKLAGLKTPQEIREDCLR